MFELFAAVFWWERRCSSLPRRRSRRERRCLGFLQKCSGRELHCFSFFRKCSVARTLAFQLFTKFSVAGRWCLSFLRKRSGRERWRLSFLRRCPGRYQSSLLLPSECSRPLSDVLIKYHQRRTYRVGPCRGGFCFGCYQGVLPILHEDAKYGDGGIPIILWGSQIYKRIFPKIRAVQKFNNSKISPLKIKVLPILLRRG